MSPVALRSIAVACFPCALLVAGATSAAGQPSPPDAGPAIDQQLQILDVEETAGTVTLEIALPPALGPLAPVDRNFGVTDGGRLVDVDVAPRAAPSTVLVVDTSGRMRGPSLDEPLPCGCKESSSSQSSGVRQCPDRRRCRFRCCTPEGAAWSSPTTQ
jgi:hypothetical protein